MFRISRQRDNIQTTEPMRIPGAAGRNRSADMVAGMGAVTSKFTHSSPHRLTPVIGHARMISSPRAE